MLRKCAEFRRQHHRAAKGVDDRDARGPVGATGVRQGVVQYGRGNSPRGGRRRASKLLAGVSRGDRGACARQEPHTNAFFKAATA